MVWGARLQKKDAAEKLAQQLKKHKKEALWTGAELIVKPRWIKRLCVAIILCGVCIICLKCLAVFPFDSAKAQLWFVLLVGLTLGLGYSAWLTLMGLLRETLAGYSLKIDSMGIHLPGYPTIPWIGIYRAGHTWIDNKGTIYNFLELECSLHEVRKQWPRTWQLFFIGPVGAGISILQGTGHFKLRATFLKLPVPTIVKAICDIGSRYAPHPVVKWNAHESLEDARRLDVLWRRAMAPIDDTEQKKAFQITAAAFSKPSGAIDQALLDKTMGDMEKALVAKSDSFKEYSQLSARVNTQHSKNFLSRIARDMKIFNWVFGGAFLLGLLYYLFRWLVG